MPDRASEGIVSSDVDFFRDGDGTDAGDEDIRLANEFLFRKPISKFDDPFGFVRIPSSAKTGNKQLNVRIEVHLQSFFDQLEFESSAWGTYLVNCLCHIPLNLWLVRKLLTPSGILVEAKTIQMTVHITSAIWIGVQMPDASRFVRRLVDRELGDPSFLKTMRHR